MVLSNKKLKRKLRTDLTGSLAESEAQNKPTITITNPDPDHHHSLKSLLDSAVKKPRLSKRQKRRQKTISHPQRSTNKDDEEVGSEAVDDQNRNNKKKKKRKRDAEGGEMSENLELNKPNKSKKKKNKKKKKTQKPADIVELNKPQESVIAQQCVPQITKTTDSQEKVDVSTKVYVGGIPYYSTEDDIRSFFEGCGSIIEIDCMTFPDSGKFRGIAIISFKTEAAAKRALELDGADMGGLFLKIQLYKATRVSSKPSDFSPAIVEGYNRIYIGNLSWDITEDDLKKLFSDCNISSIRFGEDKETGEFRGYGHVDFADSLSVTMALKLDQTIVCGRPVRIRCAVPKKSSKPNSKSEPTREKVDNGGLYSNSKSESTNEKADDGVLNSYSKSEVTNEKADNRVLKSYSKYEAAINEKADNGVLNSYSKYEATNEKADIGVPYSYSKYAATNEKADNVAINFKSDPTSEKADNGAVNLVSGKIRRRTCYVCGEKGHLSSSCPNKQAADQINTAAS